MRFTRRLNYCGECGKKLKDIEEDGIKVRFCKKCKYYLPENARYWVAFEDEESAQFYYKKSKENKNIQEVKEKWINKIK